MDRSKQYIDMCRKAGEIQKLWRRCHGDFFEADRGGIKCWISGVHDRQQMKRCVSISVENNLIQLNRYVWLPRLDQLMELAQSPGRRFENVTQEFHQWTRRPYRSIAGEPREIFSSLEQVWLAFVMHQKFIKKWRGHQWIPVYALPVSDE